MFLNAISLKLAVGPYGWRHSSVYTMKRTSQKFPLDFPFIAYLLNWNYEKSVKCNHTLVWDKFFPSSQNIDKSVSTQWCEANLISQKSGNYTFEHLNSINLKHYSQTCSNNYLFKMSNAESTQGNFCSIITMYKTCLMRPATTFFDSQMKKKPV